MRALGRAVLVVVGLALSACAAAQPDPSPTGPGWGEEIDGMTQQATSDFEREVLSDDVITREEYELAYQLFLGCVEETYPSDGQISVGLIPNAQGFYQVGVSGFGNAEPDPVVDQVLWECEVGTTALIGGLYNSMTLNPLNRDWSELEIECLIRNGVVDSGYDPEQLDLDIRGGSMEDPGFSACIDDPRTETGSS